MKVIKLATKLGSMENQENPLNIGRRKHVRNRILFFIKAILLQIKENNNVELFGKRSLQTKEIT